MHREMKIFSYLNPNYKLLSQCVGEENRKGERKRVIVNSGTLEQFSLRKYQRAELERTKEESEQVFRMN